MVPPLQRKRMLNGKVRAPAACWLGPAGSAGKPEGCGGPCGPWSWGSCVTAAWLTVGTRSHSL